MWDDLSAVMRIGGGIFMTLAILDLNIELFLVSLVLYVAGDLI